MKIGNFLEANHYLAQFYTSAPTSYTLDNMLELMGALDNPQNKYRVIHVAGTSGKTSSAYYAAALLTASGYKTGLTISPHVDEINERTQINMQPAPEDQFCAAMSEFSELLAKISVKPSWFEAMVAFAYWYFAYQKVDYAVIEVGLGGLLDGTNVITREDKVCSITDIGLDHTQILGSTLPEIALQKAGIAHKNNQVLMHRQGSAVVEVISKHCEDTRAKLSIIPDESSFNTTELPAFQKRNYSLAESAVEYLLKSDNRDELKAHAKERAVKAYIPGRMEIIEYNNKTVILDGAHNEQKLGALKEALHIKYPNQDIAGLIAFARGDEQRLDSALGVVDSMFTYSVITSFVTAKDYIKQSVDHSVVASKSKNKHDTEPSTEKAFKILMNRPEKILVVTGSFYLLNHIRPLMLNK